VRGGSGLRDEKDEIAWLPTKKTEQSPWSRRKNKGLANRGEVLGVTSIAYSQKGKIQMSGALTADRVPESQ